MAHRFQISHDSPALDITIVTKNRMPVFQSNRMREVLCHAINDARSSGAFLLFAYVIMLDHVHLLAGRPTATSDLLRVLKGLTARRIIDYLKVNGYVSSLAKLRHQERERGYRYSLWQTEKNVLPVLSEGMFMEKMNYIHSNPVRAGLVERAVEYRWSSERIWQRRPMENEPLLMDNELIHWRSRGR